MVSKIQRISAIQRKSWRFPCSSQFSQPWLFSTMGKAPKVPTQTEGRGEAFEPDWWEKASTRKNKIRLEHQWNQMGRSVWGAAVISGAARALQCSKRLYCEPRIGCLGELPETTIQDDDARRTASCDNSRAHSEDEQYWVLLGEAASQILNDHRLIAICYTIVHVV